MFYRPFRKRIRKAVVFIFFVFCVVYLVNSVLRNAGNNFNTFATTFFTWLNTETIVSDLTSCIISMPSKNVIEAFCILKRVANNDFGLTIHEDCMKHANPSRNNLQYCFKIEVTDRMTIPGPKTLCPENHDQTTQQNIFFVETSGESCLTARQVGYVFKHWQRNMV